MKMNRKKILWLSPYAPYDEVAHGGGKSHNFYVKYLHKSGLFDITLLTLCMEFEKDKLDLEEYGIKNQVFVLDRNRLQKMCRLLFSGCAYRNPFDKSGGICLSYEKHRMKQMLAHYAGEGNMPDIIILQWTFSLMLIDEIKKYFPDSRIIAIEEDVTFLNYWRKYRGAHVGYERFFWKHRYDIMHREELHCLKKVNLIVTNNPKDTRLLVDNGISEQCIFTSSPYFQSYHENRRTAYGKDILFYGAMSRPENYESAVWFIEKVLPLIPDKQVRFVIVGANPDPVLYKYKNERVEITGFVEDIGQYFSECMCMVAPLVGGAGIKIKILEALSAGVPVLTNQIGIEGIDAKDKRDYFYCEKPESYADYINEMAAGKLDTVMLSEAAKKFIEKNYDPGKKLDELKEIMSSMP